MSIRKLGAVRGSPLKCVGIAALVGILTACGGGASPSVEGPIKVGVVPSINTAMPNLAIDEQLGEPHEIELERTTIAGAGSTNQVAALLSGDIDIAVGGTNTVVDAVAEGADIQIIGGVAPLLFSIVLNTDVAAGLDVADNAPWKDKIRALKGLKLAVSPPGSTGNSVLRTLLADAGLDPDKDVELVPITDASAVPPGISQGSYDGSFMALGSGEVNVADGSGTLWLSLPQGEVPAFDDLVGVVSFTTTRFAEANPGVVKGVHNAFADAQQMSVDDPNKAAQVLKQSIFAELEPGVFDQIWNQAQGSYPEGMNFTRKNWQTFLDLFAEDSKKDYGSVEYADLVAEPGRGS